MAEHRVAVDRDLGVERDHLAVAGDDERVDLDQRRVLGDGDLREALKHLGDAVHDVVVDPRLVGELAAQLQVELLRRARCGA